MRKKFNFTRPARFVVVCLIGTNVAGFLADARAAGQRAQQHSMASRQATQAKADVPGRQHIGKASVYAGKFAGKKMADGTKMNPRSDNAASKTLALGTTARVTNLETGQSAKVTIRDRGPYVKGRILDVSSSTAHKIGIKKHTGLATVKVDPIEAPRLDGSVKPGAATHKVKANKPTSAVRRK